MLSCPHSWVVLLQLELSPLWVVLALKLYCCWVSSLSKLSSLLSCTAVELSPPWVVLILELYCCWVVPSLSCPHFWVVLLLSCPLSELSSLLSCTMYSCWVIPSISCSHSWVVLPLSWLLCIVSLSVCNSELSHF